MDKMFEKIIRLSQEELFDSLIETFKGQKKVYKRGAYLLIKGGAPVMLEAHLDTVHKESVRDICKSADENVIMSPQGIGGDDRCGVYALLQVWKNTKVKPWLLFTCDEEIGCVGATTFARDYDDGKIKMKGLNKLKFIIEIDRKGKDDAVYYECDNDEFEDYITSKGFKTQWGSCSDICETAPALGVAAVNLSSGYYNQHTLHEYIVLSELKETIRKVIDIVEESTDDSVPAFEWVEMPKTYNYGKFGWNNYSKYYDDWYWKDDYGYGIKDGDTLTAELKKVGVLGTLWEEIYRDLAECGYSVDELDYYRQSDGDASLIELYEMEYGLMPHDFIKAVAEEK